MKIKPLFDRVLALPIAPNNVTSSGITLSNQTENETKKAKIIAVGKGIFECGVFNEMQLKPNDIIFYEDHLSTKLVHENTTYVLLKQTDILAVEEN